MDGTQETAIKDRYFVFMYDNYYPRGGFLDFEKSFNIYEDALIFAMEKIAKNWAENAEIVDAVKKERVWASWE